MSNATIVEFRRLSDEEIKTLNLNKKRICANLFVGGSITKYSDGKCVATFGLDNEYVAKVNALKIGELILSLFDFVDEVQKDGITIAKR